MRHTRHRRDSNHDEILAGLKRVTTAIDIHNYGGGMGDILCRHLRTKLAVFLEVKSSPKDDLTPSEVLFSEAFKFSWARVHSLDEALAAIGVH
jgi:hypothetical protein